MRELLSLRRDEAPIIGEVYRYKNEYLKCVADKPGESCANCAFDETTCGCLCDAKSAFPLRHFETVHESEAENAADVKFRHIEETKGKPPKKEEIFIASVGLVKLTDISGTRLNDCAACDLTMLECDNCGCLPNHCYQKVKR